jgi:hypothetical protein
MYNNPADTSNGGISEDREAYLLGKRRIDHLLTANDAETSKLKKGAAVGIEAIGNENVGTARDTQKKVLQDPLLEIQKRAMEAKLNAFREAQKLEQAKERAEKRKDKERRHRHRHDRSKSRDDYDRRDRHHKRHRSERDERRRSRSPRRRESERDAYRQRSWSPRRRDSDRGDHRRRSRSPKRSDSFREGGRDDHRRRDDYRRRSRSPRRSEPSRVQDSATERLARMQADATDLDKQREERVRLREAEDAVEEEKFRNDQYGGHRFKSNINRETMGIRKDRAVDAA